VEGAIVLEELNSISFFRALVDVFRSPKIFMVFAIARTRFD
jgi:hypothetical protein